MPWIHQGHPTIFPNIEGFGVPQLAPSLVPAGAGNSFFCFCRWVPRSYPWHQHFLQPLGDAGRGTWSRQSHRLPCQHQSWVPEEAGLNGLLLPSGSNFSFCSCQTRAILCSLTTGAQGVEVLQEGNSTVSRGMGPSGHCIPSDSRRWGLRGHCVAQEGDPTLPSPN